MNKSISVNLKLDGVFGRRIEAAVKKKKELKAPSARPGQPHNTLQASVQSSQYRK